MTTLRKHLLSVLLIFVLATIQTTLTPMLLPKWLQPDLMLAMAALLGLLFQPALGSVYAFGIGYLQDLINGTMIGLFAFERVVIFLAAYWLAGLFYARSALAQAALVGVLSIADFLLLFLLSSVFYGERALDISFWSILPRSISSAIFGFALYFPLGLIWRGEEREL